MNYAVDLGHKVIAFTEHETIANAIKIEKAYNKIKKEHPDFKVILGNEIYLVRDGLTKETYIRGQDKFYHFILLAKNARGHEQIRELSTRAFMRAFKRGKMLQPYTIYQDLYDIVAKEPGNIIASTACLGGFLPSCLLRYQEMQQFEYLETAKGWAKDMQAIFGKENFYLELQPSFNKEQVFVNSKILEISNELSIPAILTTDSHYLKKEDANIHEAFLTAQEGEREVKSFYSSTYMMSDEEIRSYIADYISEEDIQTMYSNIVHIKDMCEDYSLLKPLRIPTLKWKTPNTSVISDEWFERIPMLKTFYESDFEGDKVLAQTIVDRVSTDITLQNTESYNELNDNLRITKESSDVNKTHWSSYFLNLQKIIDICWDAGSLVGCGRGSGVGFLLLYVLGITQINPLRETTKTYSWRFLNPSRVSVLDVDIDISGLRRAEVLKAFRKEYGEDRVANVATFGTEKSKSAITTACRGLGIDVDDAQYLAGMIPIERGAAYTLKQTFYGDPDNNIKPNKEFVHAMTVDFPEVWEVAQKIEGLICRTGIHAGGLIFVDEDFTKSTGLMRAPDGTIITQFDLHDAEAASQRLGS